MMCDLRVTASVFDNRGQTQRNTIIFTQFEGLMLVGDGFGMVLDGFRMPLGRFRIC